jgi:hypothetical protein
MLFLRGIKMQKGSFHFRFLAHKTIQYRSWRNKRFGPILFFLVCMPLVLQGCSGSEIGGIVGEVFSGAVSMSFTDNDEDGGEISGTVNVSRASNELGIDTYNLYWASGPSTKMSDGLIIKIDKSEETIVYEFSENTAIPMGATHLIVYTERDGVEMATGVSVAIVDLGVPVNPAVGIAFTDTDSDANELEGDVNITRALDESDVTDYVLYWGSDATTKQSATAIATIAKTGSDLVFTFAADTAKPALATHLLVFTRNADGEMGTGASLAIVDLGVPVNPAVGIAFTDTDSDANELEGDVNITRALDESDVTDYVLYWGSDATTKQSATAIATIAKTGSDLVFTFAADTAKPALATHLLVFTRNADGEMGTGASLAIVDLGVPVNPAVGIAFTDTDSDANELEGDVNITRALDESDVTDYVLYWGSDATTKQSATAIATIAKTGSDLVFTFAADTAKPALATHLLVFTRNADGEMGTGVSEEIVDSAILVPGDTTMVVTKGDYSVRCTFWSGNRCTRPEIENTSIFAGSAYGTWMYLYPNDGTRRISACKAFCDLATGSQALENCGEGWTGNVYSTGNRLFGILSGVNFSYNGEGYDGGVHFTNNSHNISVECSGW